MATAFKQTKDNARSLVATAPSPATSGTSLIVTAADGTKFPTPGNGFWATIWNATSFPDPTNDVNQERVFVSAVSTDTFTMTRAQLGTSARTVTTADTIALLDVSQLFADFVTAINALENDTTHAHTSWAVIAASGGDYTTLGAAYTAGARNFLVTPGTYTESTGTLSAWAASVTIIGMNRDTCIIQLAAGATGNLALSGAGTVLRDITIKEPNTNTTNAYDGWTSITAVGATFDNVLFLGQDSASNTGNSVALKSGSKDCKFVNCEFRNASSSGALSIVSTTGLVIEGCKFFHNQGFGIGLSAFSGSSGSITYVRIANCFFSNAGTGNCIKSGNVGTTPAYVSIIGNTFVPTVATNSTIEFQNGTGVVAPLTISNNIIDNQKSTGGITIRASQDGMVLTGNTILRNGTSTNDPTIYAGTCFGAVVNDNTIICTAASTSGVMGIGSACSESDISGNFITGFLGANSVAIDLSYGGSIRCTVSNNKIGNCATGINGTTGSNVLSNNIFKSDVTTPYKVGAGSSITNRGLFLTKTTTYTATANDGTILADATSAAFTVTLPTAVLNVGLEFTVIKKDSSVNAVTVATTAGNINGSATASLASQYNSITVRSDGTNYYKVASI